MDDLLKDSEDAIALVRNQINQIYDPCGSARGLSIGLVDMGLIRNLEVQRQDNGWQVLIKIRFTSPDCLYFFYFEREIHNRLAVFPQIETVKVEWDEVCDWSPDDLSATAQVTVKAHNEKLRLVALRRNTVTA